MGSVLVLSHHTELCRFPVFNEKYWLLKETIQTKKFSCFFEKNFYTCLKEAIFFK